MAVSLLQAEKTYLSGLLEAIQRCIYFLGASDNKIAWPLAAEYLSTHKKDVALFEALAGINERFVKLQDTLGASMRHAALLYGRPFLKVMSFYEKAGVIESVTAWQLCRIARNLAAHDSETDSAEIAEDFNSLHVLVPQLYIDAARSQTYCLNSLGVKPMHEDFADEFSAILHKAKVPGY